MNITKVREGDCTWVSVIGPTQSDAVYFRDTFGIHPLDVDDIFIAAQRPKLSSKGGYLFLELLFPVYDRAQRAIVPFEIDFFLVGNTLITIQETQGPILNDLCEKATTNDESRKELLGSGSVGILLVLLDRLLTATFPMIDHINKDLKEIEQRLFTGNEKMFLEELLIARRNLAVFRKVMQGHKHMLKKLHGALLDRNHLASVSSGAFDTLVEYTKEIWDALEIQREEVETLSETNETLISYRLNEIMRKFTTLSVIIFAMTLLAGVLAIDASDRPQFAFWVVLVMEMLVAGFLYFVFKRKRWL